MRDYGRGAEDLGAEAMTTGADPRILLQAANLLVDYDTPTGPGYCLVLSLATDDATCSNCDGEGPPRWLEDKLDSESRTGSVECRVTIPRIQVASPDPDRGGLVPTRLANVPDMLAAIRSSLSLQIKEIAMLVGVERPTIYAWLQDKSTPSQQNRNRLQQIFSAACRWDRLCHLPMGDGVRSVTEKGNSILELLSRTPIPEAELDSLMRTGARLVFRSKLLSW
jgi:transcriptional regulator with XRE-family HTH domain